MDLSLLPQAIVSGVLAAGLYALVSVGLALAIGVIGIVNFAHGEFFMVGAFPAYPLFASFRFDTLLSLPFGAPALAVIGAAIYVSSTHSDLKAPALTKMLRSFGIANVPYRSLGYQFAGVSIGMVPLGSFVISLILVGALYWMLASTPLGRAMRAVAQNRVGAGLVGLEVNRVYLVAFALSALLAGV